jgi:hypothetical protein
VPEPKAKALSFNGIIRCIQKMVSPAGYQRFLEALDAETRTVVVTPLPQGSWMPLRHESAVIDAVFANAFDSSMRRIGELGRLSTMEDLKGPYKVFLKLFSPLSLVPRANRIWQMYYQGNGELSCPETGVHWGKVKYGGIAFPSALYWEFHRGSLLGWIEATRVKNVKVTIESGGGISRECVYVIEWSP